MKLTIRSLLHLRVVLTVVFYACAPKSNINRAAKASELLQEQMNYQVESGKATIKCPTPRIPQVVRPESDYVVDS